jgi:phosphoglycerate kinase
MNLQSLESLDFNQKRVFLRLDLNVPIENGVVVDDSRILASLPTIKYVLERTRSLVIASHLGRPKGVAKKEFSLAPVGEILAKHLNKEVVLVENYNVEPYQDFWPQITKDQILLLENLRFFPEETSNDPRFSESLAKGCHLYINDAFGVLHREHASVTGICDYIPREYRACGFLIQKELEGLKPLMSPTKFPYTVVLGGGKVTDKVGVILNLLKQCHHLVIGGAMAYSFLKYKGIEVGSSPVEKNMQLIESIFSLAQKRRVQIHLPEDHIYKDSFDKAQPAKVSQDQDLPKGAFGVDIGPRTQEAFSKIIAQSNLIFWNGPMGVYEWEDCQRGTEVVARAIGESQGYSVAGGGDSAAALNKMNPCPKFSFVSTGGGASLSLLEGEGLVGLKALERN